MVVYPKIAHEVTLLRLFSYLVVAEGQNLIQPCWFMTEFKHGTGCFAIRKQKPEKAVCQVSFHSTCQRLLKMAGKTSSSRLLFGSDTVKITSSSS